MKKFNDAKATMSNIKFKMQLKAETQTEYQVFCDEIRKINSEHTAFIENLEYQIAVADSLDPVQDVFFCFQGVCTCIYALFGIGGDASFMHVYIHVQEAMPPSCTPSQKEPHQANDEDIDKMMTSMDKGVELLGQHQTGTVAAKKKYEAMLGQKVGLQEIASSMYMMCMYV